VGVFHPLSPPKSQKNRLYYEYTLNQWSYVNVDAKTGEIIGWYFHDGVVY
jgi:hypothetical protein